MVRAVLLGGLGSLLVALLFAGGPALSASNTVAPSALGRYAQLTETRDFVPAECLAVIPGATIDIMDIRYAAAGNGQPNLILGTDGPDNISAGNGDDCVVGG
ncbi:MAG: hypothetical protein KC461_01125, partial [Dehalococcoidia bacterium]|nr:hypothetical protein [Dehalococcoidia bacterium]